MIELNNSQMRKEKLKVTQTLSKIVKVNVTDEDLNIKEIFEREHWDLKSLLSVLKSYVIYDLSHKISSRSTRQLEVILLACDSWNEDEYKVAKE